MTAQIFDLAAGTYAEQETKDVVGAVGDAGPYDGRRRTGVRMANGKFSRIRTGQSYDILGLIYFVSRNSGIVSERVRDAIRESCAAAAGRSGNERALLEYMTTGKSKVQIMMRYHIASETSMDRMVRRYYIEMERRLREIGKDAAGDGGCESLVTSH